MIYHSFYLLHHIAVKSLLLFSPNAVPITVRHFIYPFYLHHQKNFFDGKFVYKKLKSNDEIASAFLFSLCVCLCFCLSLSLSLSPDVLEQSVCQALSLTGISVEPDNLQVCHCMRKKDRVIIKFKFRKQKHLVLLNRKISQIKVSILHN